MLTRETPLSWRQGFILYRRRLAEDSLGNPTAVYHMDQPDFVAEDGTAEGICWQSVRSWQTPSQVSGGERPAEWGEEPTGVMEGYLFSALVLSTFDRLRVGEELYEIRSIQRWPSHRRILARRLA